MIGSTLKRTADFVLMCTMVLGAPLAVAVLGLLFVYGVFLFFTYVGAVPHTLVVVLTGLLALPCFYYAKEFVGVILEIILLSRSNT